MWLRRALIGCGALFLALLMLVGTLSVGIYIGERGVLRGRAQQNPSGPPGPAAARPIGPQGGPVPTAAAPLAAPGGPPNVIGTLQRYGDNTITLTTMQGPRMISLTPQTTVRGENAAAQVSDLRPGMPLAVWGDPGERGRVLVARVVLILPQQQK